MFKYIIKKIAYGFLVLWGVLTIVFFLFNILPGDPSRMMLDQREDSKQLAIIKSKYGFDKSIIEQYFLYINDVSPLSIHYKSPDSFTFLEDGKYSHIKLHTFTNFYFVIKIPYLRDSFIKKNVSVVSIISQTFKNTFILAVSSITIALVLGLFAGIFSALYKDTLIDKLILFFSVLGMSLPSFFTSIIIAWFFGFLLHQYTGLSMTGNLFEIDDYGRGIFLEPKNLILPALTLGVRPLSVIIQLSRSSFLDVLSKDYIRTAIAKGLGRFKVLFKHALINALNPVITAVSGWLASLLAGAVFVEYIFAWNGIGKEIVDALNTMDLPLIMGLVLFIATIFVIINIVVDLLYIWVDPRIKT